jgi:hypothetical protein
VSLLVAFLVVIPEGNLLLPLSDPLTRRATNCLTRQHPKKTESRGTFFTTTQATTNAPQSTIHSPRTHHKKTTRKTQKPWKFATSTIANI